MSTENRFTPVAIVIGVLGIGIGVGLVIASFLVGLDTADGSLLSSSGTITAIVFVVISIVLAAATKRNKHTSGSD